MAWNAERISPTEWIATIDCGGWNNTVDIVVTAEGVKVNSQLVSWTDLADARQFFTMKDDRK